MLRRVGEVAYEIELSHGSILHNTFHVSCLKKVVGQNVTPFIEFPPLDDEGQLVLEPETVLDTRERKLRSKVIKEYLIKWRGFPDEDATLGGS